MARLSLAAEALREAGARHAAALLAAETARGDAEARNAKALLEVAESDRRGEQALAALRCVMGVWEWVGRWGGGLWVEVEAHVVVTPCAPPHPTPASSHRAPPHPCVPPRVPSVLLCVFAR